MPGIKQVRIKLCEEATLYSMHQLTCPADAIEVMADELKNYDVETVLVVNLDVHLRPLNYHVVTIGDVSGAQIVIRGIFKSAILSNATSVMLFHNHPGGDTTPSDDDIKVTKKIVQAGKLLGIGVTDHIIVGRYGTYCSMRKAGIVEF